MKKFLFSAVALVGFTVASYGANTVEVEVNESLLVEEKVELSSDRDKCTTVAKLAYDLFLSEGYDITTVETWTGIVYRNCMATITKLSE